MANPDGEGRAPSATDLSAKPPENIVIPPSTVRESVAKTAEFIFRRGPEQLPAMQQRVASGQASAMRFVLEEDPYHLYFMWYLQQLKEGKGPAPNKSAMQVAAKPKGPEEPPKFRYSARMPNISAKDFEVVKLTALYTARCGENWLKELRNRESGNFQFDFLRQNHSFWQFFRSLVEQYKTLLEDEVSVETRVAELRQNVNNRYDIVKRAKDRSEYIKYVSAEKEKEVKRKEDERKDFQSINWTEFAVVTTVNFDEVDDGRDLPTPTLLNDLQSQSLEQKAMISLSTRRLEEALPDEPAYYNVSQQHVPPPPMQPNYGPMAPPIHDPYSAYAPPPQEYQTPGQMARGEEQTRLVMEREAESNQRARAQAAARGAPGRIVTDYVPRAALKKASTHMSICPNCKQSVPDNEIAEHMRSKYTLVLVM
jgi:splicing factor 3A subunit 1